MSPLPLGILAASIPGGAYWIGYLNNAGDDYGTGCDYDADGNVYFCSGINTGSGFDMHLMKMNSKGVLQWQRSLSGVAGDWANEVAVTATGTVYMVGYGQTTISGTQSNNYIIVKYNTSGVLQWQITFGGTDYDEAINVAFDSAENVYVVGRTGGAPNSQINKYNSSGVLQYQKFLGGAPNLFTGVAVDSSDNVYAAGRNNQTGVLAKYNSAGTLQWQRTIGDPAFEDFHTQVAVDSLGNAYTVARMKTGGDSDFGIYKYDTSGNLQWQRSLHGGGYDMGFTVDCDVNDNIYVGGRSDADGGGYFFAKYNSSGVIQWQRRLKTGSYDEIASIKADPNGNLYMNGYSNVFGTNGALFAKLPADGSKTGTYTVGSYSMTYAATSATDSATSYTSVTSTLSEQTTTLSSATASLTDAATTFTIPVSQL